MDHPIHIHSVEQVEIVVRECCERGKYANNTCSRMALKKQTKLRILTLGFQSQTLPTYYNISVMRPGPQVKCIMTCCARHRFSADLS